MVKETILSPSAIQDLSDNYDVDKEQVIEETETIINSYGVAYTEMETIINSYEVAYTEIDISHVLTPDMKTGNKNLVNTMMMNAEDHLKTKKKSMNTRSTEMHLWVKRGFIRQYRCIRTVKTPSSHISV